jgi:hypothetical protein
VNVACWRKACLIALVAVSLAGLLSGCTATSPTAPPTNSPAASTTLVPFASPSLPDVTPSPGASLATATPAAPLTLPTATATATPSPTPETPDEPSATSCPPIQQKGGPAPASTTAPLAPAGTWSSITWQRLPDDALPDDFAACVFDGSPAGGIYAFGWSKGYVVLEYGVTELGQPDRAVTYASSDGLTWHRGRPFSLVSIEGLSNGADDFYMVEGPAGLAIVAITQPQICGWAPPVLNAVLTSKDGLNWRFMSLTPFDEAGVNYLAGGGAGYLATGSSQDGVNSAWTSTDLVTWHKVALATAGFKDSLIQGGAVFTGGFVMTGYTWNMIGCTGTDPLMVKPAAWLLAGGGSWAPVSLPGSTLGAKVQTRIVRVTDRLLVVEASSTSGKVTTTGHWVSHDGVTWTKITDPGLDFSHLLSDGGRAFIVDCPRDDRDDCSSGPTITQIDDTLGAATVAQTGFTLPNVITLPDSVYDNWGPDSLALGPTGMLYYGEDGIWFGSPSA